jgi:uncharacterized protein YggT (Ycf19 family)
MVSERKERVIVRQDEDYAQKKRIVEHNVSLQQVLVSRVSHLIWFIVAIVNALLIFRFSLKMIGANPVNQFVNFLYSVTNPMVYPFQNIVANPSVNETANIEVSVLFAILVYSFAAWALISAIRILFSDTGSSRRITSYEKQG